MNVYYTTDMKLQRYVVLDFLTSQNSSKNREEYNKDKQNHLKVWFYKIL